MDSVNTLKPVLELFFNLLAERLKEYLLTGGMLEPVKVWAFEKDPNLVRIVQNDILNAYSRDLSKHASQKDKLKINLIWGSLPSQLARENKRFMYKLVQEGARAREYEDALQWLVDASLVHKIHKSTYPGLPLSAYDDNSSFKIYSADVGLLGRLANLDYSVVAQGNLLFSEFKGALAENFILQSIIGQFEAMPRYWTVDNPKHEVDYLIQECAYVIPVEVKAGTNVKSLSLKKFKEIYGEKVKLRVRFSMENLKLDGDLLNIPLFMADYAKKLIDMAMREMQ
jgi:predicted AAA+ superfamily ATPase